MKKIYGELNSVETKDCNTIQGLFMLSLLPFLQLPLKRVSFLHPQPKGRRQRQERKKF